MTTPASTYEIAFHPAHTGPAHALGYSSDANAATIIAHELLERLRKQGRGGEVRVVQIDAEPTVVLRLPLLNRPTRIQPPRRPSRGGDAVTAHPGWTATPHTSA